MNRKFIFIDIQNSMAMQYIMNDIKDRDDVIYLRVFERDKTLWDRFLNKLVLLSTVDYWFSFLFYFLNPLCKKRYQLYNLNFSDKTHYYIVFGDGTIKYFSNRFIKQLRRKEQFTPIALLYNPYSHFRKTLKKKLILFEGNVFSFDDNDSKTHGFYCTHEIYSMLIKPSHLIEKDIYYIGAAKDRLACLINLFEDAKKNNVKTDFNIAFVSDNEREHEDEINYCQLLPYPETLTALDKCNCILEVQQSGQSGATLRYYEAVCYNKKLLTNNRNVINLSFYCPDYIHVFENTGDIDWTWVKEQIPVDYHYDGRFSPVHLLDKITKLEKLNGGATVAKK